MATLNPAKSHGYYSVYDKQFHSSQNDLYMNDDAISNAIHYVTRTGKRIDRAEELVTWGAVGCCDILTPDECIIQFNQVQKLVRRNKEVGTRLVHEILTFSDEEAAFLLNNISFMVYLADYAASLYYLKGFQCVYGIHMGIHYDDNDLENSIRHKRLHIHFIVNAVSFITGNKFATKLSNKVFSLNEETFFKVPYDTKLREDKINHKLYNDIMGIYNPYSAAQNNYIKNAYSYYPNNDM